MSLYYNFHLPFPSKASADHLIKAYVRTYKIQAIVTNCCNNYGPNQFPEKLIPKLIINIMNNKPLPIYAKGKNSREWMHVQDHCEALLKIYLKGKIGESYNVGSGVNLQNIDIAKKLLKPNGVLCCAIDDYELFSLLGLFEKLKARVLGIIVVVIKPEGRNQEKYIMFSR